MALASSSVSNAIPQPSVSNEQDDPADLAEANTICDSLFENIPQEGPYVLYVLSDVPYQLPKERRDDWRRGTPFDPSEEHLQYQSFLYRDPTESVLHLESAFQEERRLREEAVKSSSSIMSGANTPSTQQQPKKKISLAQYQNRKPETSQRATPNASSTAIETKVEKTRSVDSQSSRPEGTDVSQIEKKTSASSTSDEATQDLENRDPKVSAPVQSVNRQNIEKPLDKPEEVRSTKQQKASGSKNLPPWTVGLPSLPSTNELPPPISLQKYKLPPWDVHILQTNIDSELPPTGAKDGAKKSSKEKSPSAATGEKPHPSNDKPKHSKTDSINSSRNTPPPKSTQTTPLIKAKKFTPKPNHAWSAAVTGKSVSPDHKASNASQASPNNAANTKTSAQNSQSSPKSLKRGSDELNDTASRATKRPKPDSTTNGVKSVRTSDVDDTSSEHEAKVRKAAQDLKRRSQELLERSKLPQSAVLGVEASLYFLELADLNEGEEDPERHVKRLLQLHQYALGIANKACKEQAELRGIVFHVLSLINMKLAAAFSNMDSKKLVADGNLSVARFQQSVRDVGEYGKMARNTLSRDSIWHQSKEVQKVATLNPYAPGLNMEAKRLSAVVKAFLQEWTKAKKMEWKPALRDGS